MTWRSYFWPCAFFFLLGIMIGLGSGVFAYRYRKALVRNSDRLTSSVIQIAKSTVPVSSNPEAAKTTTNGPLVLASFENEHDLRLFSDSDARLERMTEHATDGQYALKVTIPDGGGALGAWRSLPSDWSSYDKLVFDVYSPEGGPPLSLYVKDSKRISYRARYNEENIRLKTGPNVIEVPLKDIARKIDLKDIMQFRVFLWKVPDEHVYYFDNFRLESTKQAKVEGPPPQSTPTIHAGSESASKPSSHSLKPPRIDDQKGSLTLASFESESDLRLFGDSEARLERTTEHATDGQYSVKVTMPDGGGALGAWRSLPSDWSGYEKLVFDVYSPEGGPPLSLYVKDSKRISYGARYNEENIRLKTGPNVIEVPLKDIARKIDLKDIMQFRVFLWKVPGQHVYYFDNFRLVGGKSDVSREAQSAAVPIRTAGDHTGVQIWAVGESYKIRPTGGKPFNPAVKRDLKRKNEVWDGATKTVSLAAARNEYMGFQIIIEALDKPLEKVSVAHSDLKGPTTIGKKHIQLFREHYITVNRPSGWPQPSTGAGEYPDPLVPLDLPNGGAPFDVPSGRNQAVWVDIYIPDNASPGLYTGTFRVKANGREASSLNVNLEVWGFSLPKESHLTFWSNYYDLSTGYNLPKGKLDPIHQVVERDLWRMTHRHRIAALLRHTPPRPKYTGSGNNLKVDWSTFDQRVGPYLDGTVFEDNVKPNIFLLPITFAHGKHWPPGDDETFLAMCKAFARHFDEKGWDLGKTLIYLGDEPTEKEFPAIKRLARRVRQADPRFKTTVAFIKFPPKVVEEFSGLVDLWMIDAGEYNSQLLEPRKAKGELTGFYQQSEPYVGNESLDSDGLAFRTWPWIAWKYQVDVVYLYSMTEWWRARDRGKDPWVDPLNWDKSNNQGIIIYPGRNLKTHRVIGSVRMKQIRRGMQDYEYIYLAKKSGADPSPVVDSIIHRALDETYRGWGSPGKWERDPARWLEARKKLAALILKGQKAQAKRTKSARPDPPS